MEFTIYENRTNSSEINETVILEDNFLGEDLKILMKVVPFLVPVIFTLIIVIGFIGNLLVVCVVMIDKKMINTTNLLILNLAVS